MAAGAATATTIAEYLMSVWPEKRLLIETYKDSPLLGLIKKEKKGGRKGDQGSQPSRRQQSWRGGHKKQLGQYGAD
jgi:hypothetical protein